MNPLSVCIIAKNEEQYLEQCLKSIAPLDCEIVIIDTGSTDSTIKIAKSYTSHIHSFDWTNDFSAARNYAVSKASFDTILILDCDEQIDDCDMKGLLALAAVNKTGIGYLKILNLIHADSRDGAYSSTLGRLFDRNHYHYEGTIHEQITPIGHLRPYRYDLPLSILHYGYIESQKRASAKHERNIRMLKKALLSSPEDPYYHFQLGQEYYNLGNYADAIPCYDTAVSLLGNALSPNIEYHRLALQARADSLLFENRIDEALSYALYEKEFGFVPDYYYLMGRIYCGANRPMDAMMQFIKATSMSNPRKEGVNTYLSWYHMGLINESLGNPDGARMFYEKCGTFSPALDKLRELNGGN